MVPRNLENAKARTQSSSPVGRDPGGPGSASGIRSGFELTQEIDSPTR